MSKLTEEALVAKYAGMAYNLALRLSGNVQDAQDIAQESLLKALRSLGDFREEASTGTWIYRITFNTWKNWVRSEKRRRSWHEALWNWLQRPKSPAAGEGEPAEPAQKSGLEMSEEKEAVDRAMEALAPEDRAILVLRELDGRSYREIADSLHLEVGTVKSRLFRARESLAGRLSAYFKT
ncbi:MAG: sigma-70 family RNA polymerase sigma factor [Elusimicrobia bacterium]|nr:sigma-70 family RNA polymerase sigma factor [Elusimicrobiota bacterium]